jgi:hypothetical protein
MAKNQHVVKRGDKWVVKGVGNQRATRVVESRSKAIRIARKIARNQGSDVVIHGRDGKIRARDIYGRDHRLSHDAKH